MDLDWIKANGSYEIYSVEWVNSQRKVWSERFMSTTMILATFILISNFTDLQHKCCGIDSRKDWYQTSKVDMYKTKEALAEMESWFIYPDSCCKPLNQVFLNASESILLFLNLSGTGTGNYSSRILMPAQASTHTEALAHRMNS